MMIPRLIELAKRLTRYYGQRGLLATGRFVVSRLFRSQKTLIYQANLEEPRPPVEWDGNERVLHFGPDSLDEANVTPKLCLFLGGDAARENLQGVRNGDHLFVVADQTDYLHRGYIIFRTRQSKIIGDPDSLPLIAYCYTDPKARGRGLYRRALNAQLSYLRNQGHKRVLIETEPANIASRKGIEGAGFSLAWEARAWIILNLFVVQCLQDQTGRRWRVLFV